MAARRADLVFHLGAENPGLHRRARRLQRALEQSQTLQTVYTMKQKLADVWQRSATTQDQLVQALQDWCREAEATGIQALKDFATKLRHVRLVQTTA